MYYKNRVSLKISKEGDHLFSLVADSVYHSVNHSGTTSYYSLDGTCHQFKNDLDVDSVARMLVSKSVLSNTLIVSFKGTDKLKDVIIDMKIIHVKCPFSNEKINCGQIHEGFATAYYSIRSTLESYIRNLDQEYDLYMTGHSLGGSIALVALVDMLSREPNTFPKIRSLNVITFGQPPIGDATAAQFLKDNSNRYTYRRYQNIDGNDVDPLTIIPFSTHANDAIKLQCNRSCPITSFGLHSLDLCTASKNSEMIVDIKGTDTYSLCLMSSMKFYDYSYKSDSSCNVKNDKSHQPLIDRMKTSYQQNYSIAQPDDFVVVLENHNKVLPTTFSYNITLQQKIDPPSAPRSLYINKVEQLPHRDKINIKHYTWMVNWKAPEFTGRGSNSTTLDYYLYLSPPGENWKHFKFTEPLTSLFLNYTIKDIPNNNYTVVVIADNSLESHPSNIFYITT
ncbi:hypothetical protein PPL_07168 [Heterostelium album PN500]|uniref:Fibronectin type-III domain-containing protein n=1 Tax=Heterostelium pallidum (strain ATCC 26659 / Pp 5 / PN500) TaxID=670386 RepID=D3BEK4_HETP5|nr:hypothetical protein PPL_07168 [Heterostelium album PN500]EFA80335.1 hypothetical protein PPL_07168 [Heterostelium album PN500]|eukprot:XP_020432455.1 hypothetical protein PPL_07168 [Heterostelium album PN500]